MSDPVILRPGDPDYYADVRHERKEHGGIIIDGQQVASTLQCPHCGGHFISRAGSGTRRTYCFSCNAVTCGNSACDPCIVWERKMEMIELKATQALRGL